MRFKKEHGDVIITNETHAIGNSTYGDATPVMQRKRVILCPSLSKLTNVGIRPIEVI